jgi:hypothetical protein
MAVGGDAARLAAELGQRYGAGPGLTPPDSDLPVAQRAPADSPPPAPDPPAAPPAAAASAPTPQAVADKVYDLLRRELELARARGARPPGQGDSRRRF